MNFNNSNIIYPQFSNTSNYKQETKVIQNPTKKPSALDKFETSIINSADLNDMVQVPRTIFKGYLAFMAGTALGSVAMVTKNKHIKLSNFLNIVSAGLLLFGTFSFVRPYIIRNSQENKL